MSSTSGCWNTCSPCFRSICMPSLLCRFLSEIPQTSVDLRIVANSIRKGTYEVLDVLVFWFHDASIVNNCWEKCLLNKVESAASRACRKLLKKVESVASRMGCKLLPKYHGPCNLTWSIEYHLCACLLNALTGCATGTWTLLPPLPLHPTSPKQEAKMPQNATAS